MITRDDIRVHCDATISRRDKLYFYVELDQEKCKRRVMVPVPDSVQDRAKFLENSIRRVGDDLYLDIMGDLNVSVPARMTSDINRLVATCSILAFAFGLLARHILEILI